MTLNTINFIMIFFDVCMSALIKPFGGNLSVCVWLDNRGEGKERSWSAGGGMLRTSSGLKD